MGQHVLAGAHLQHRRLTVTQQQLIEAALGSAACIAGFCESLRHVPQHLCPCVALVMQQLGVILWGQKGDGDVEICLQHTTTAV